MTPHKNRRDARLAGLVYVSDDEPGFTRKKRGRGFSYTDPSGNLVTSQRHKDWFTGLAIPPAWTDVWICPTRNGHLLATGRDAKGRKQYLYHPEWMAARQEAKFDRMYDFGRALMRIRKRTTEHLELDGLPRERVLALVAQLMDETLIRVGNAEYAAKNSTYGLTTLRSSHVNVNGDVIEFAFEAKNATPIELAIANPDLAPLVAECEELGAEELFAYFDGNQVVDVTSNDMNDYLREVSGVDATAKDFRTWGGSSTAVRYLATTEGAVNGASPFLAAVDAAAEALHNTRAVARASYVHPALEEAFESGAMLRQWRKTRRGRWYQRPEGTLLKLLAG